MEGCDEAVFVLSLSKRIVEKVLLSDLKPDQVSIRQFLVTGSHVPSAHQTRLDRAGKCIGPLHVLIKLSVNSARLKTCHCFVLQLIGRGPFTLLNRQLELVQESEGGPSLLLHNVVRHLAIEADFKGT